MRLFTPLRLMLITAAALSASPRSAHAESASPLLRYEVAEQKWEANLGSHRAIVSVSSPGQTAMVRLEWRRRDPNPEAKAVIVMDARTGKRVLNVKVQEFSRESALVAFQPVSGPGTYHLYFLPGEPGSGAFPSAKYLPAENTTSPDWQPETSLKNEAAIVRWEARTEHDRFGEMEIIATRAEKDAWLKTHPESFFTFLEPAERPVQMFDDVPQVWTLPRGPSYPECPAGEPLVFQIGVWAARKSLTKVQIRFRDLVRSGGGPRIEGSRLRCLQTSGTNRQHSVYVPQDGVTSLWCGLHTNGLPEGTYVGEAEVFADGIPAARVDLRIHLSEAKASASAYAEPQRRAKLLWLDSDIGNGDSPLAPFTPLQVEGRTIRCLGRSVELDDNGMPRRMTSFFNSGVTKIGTHGKEILAAPIRWVVSPEEGPDFELRPKGLHFTRMDADSVEWTSDLEGAGVTLSIRGRMEADGHLEFRCALSAAAKTTLRDIRLEIPRTPETTKYGMGLGLYGGAAPATLDWRWDAAGKHQDALWLGDVNAGLRVQWKAENYTRPMVNIHYTRQPLNDPPSWSGGGKGGVRVGNGDGMRLVCAYSGPRTLVPGSPLHFDMDFSVTPFRALNTGAQWTERYYHTSGVPADPAKVRELGANVVNIHQGNALNPYINYPFLTADRLREYGRKAHSEGLRVKHYYTVRELTNWCPELPALRAFGNELLAEGKGGGHAWCEEHLGGNYLGAWYSGSTNDASILTATMSRFHNFYLEGLDWLVKNTGCDGIYLDDVSYDRSITKRARRILNQNPRGALIDLHSWNEMNARAGFASCSMVFMDSFPFLDRLWLGEGHHYDGPPEQTLVAVSGIPFGLMGEMLEGGGNPWLGLTFGMTGRLGWGGAPQSVWQLWDSFQVAGSEFHGWWDEENPVVAEHPECRATVWRKQDRTLVVLANFGEETASTRLNINFEKLGLQKAKAHLYAPPMKAFQPELLFEPDATVTIAPKRALAFIVDESTRTPTPPAATVNMPADKLIFEDTFLPQMDASWKTVASNRAAVRPDGQGLVFSGPAHTHVWIERPLPPGASMIAAQLRQDSGDESQQYGPGLALVWPDGKLLKACRRRDGRFGLSVAGKEQLAGTCDPALPLSLVIHLDGEILRVIATGEGAFGQDQELASVPLSRFQGQPQSLRVGKIPNSGDALDHTTPGQAGWSRTDWVRIYSR